jgi:hypothetical protein
MSNVFTMRLQVIADAMGAVPDCPKHTPECPPAPWETCPECVAAGKREAALEALASMWAALDAGAKFSR